MRDPVRCKVGGVCPADEQMTGVQAQRDGRAVEYPLHLGARLDQCADVRVQNGSDSLASGEFGDPVQVGQQSQPATVVELGASVISCCAAVGREDEDCGAGGGVRVQGAFHARYRVMIRQVEQQRGEATDGLQSGSISTRAIAAGSFGRKTSGPSSVASKPIWRISFKTRSGPNW